MQARPQWWTTTVLIWLLCACPPSFGGQAPCTGACGESSTFDGANCYLGRVPESSSPFVLRNEIFYRRVPGQICPIGEPAGAMCRISGIPALSVAFVDEGRIYHTPACEDPSEWTEWASFESEAGGLNGRAGHRRIHLKWQLKEDAKKSAGRLEVLYGQAGARQDSLETIMPEPLRSEILPWIVRQSCTVRRYLESSSEQASRPPDICRNGGVLQLDGWVDEAWLRDLRLDLTYRVEVHIYTGSDPVVLGPLFLTTSP